jgi:small subunit ribosomal protein S16
MNICFVISNLYYYFRNPILKKLQMATKIRLQRHGKKGNAFFHIVVADGRAPRDGRYIEKLGTYNPVTNPATIELNFERAVHWVSTGATPTDTTKALLSYKGVMMKEHLLRGVAKGALTLEQAEAKFQDWLNSKEAKISGKINKLAASKKSSLEEKLANEKAVKDARTKAISEKAAELAAAELAALTPAEETAAEAPSEEAPAE